MDKIKFMASLPNIQSAISIGGDGIRIKLDIPETDKAELLKLAAFGPGKLLEVEIAIVEVD